MTFDGETVSMSPSIGNWALRCQSHYIIRRNQVLWRRKFTTQEIINNRANDRAAIERQDAINTIADALSDQAGEKGLGFWARLIHRRRVEHNSARKRHRRVHRF